VQRLPSQHTEAVHELELQERGEKKLVLQCSCRSNELRPWLSAGFTNGCFDIVKLWAISSPSAVRAGCDKLVVALNAGASVRALKASFLPWRHPLL
jgi:D-beta-D-heptose 7-phosphate kinase / D-beta-D-heptose 1-phosphate adenosyltransferase